MVIHIDSKLKGNGRSTEVNVIKTNKAVQLKTESGDNIVRNISNKL